MAVVKLQAASFFTISCQVTDQWFWRETIDIFHSATCCAETATFAKFFDCGYNYTHGQYIALCKWPSTLTHQKCMWLMLVPSYWAYLNWLMFPQINAEFCVFYSFILSIHWFIWNLHCVWLVLPARQCLNAYVPFKLHISSIHVMVNKLHHVKYGWCFVIVLLSELVCTGGSNECNRHHYFHLINIFLFILLDFDYLW